MGYEKSIKKVSGKKGKDILLFALSTCPWCKKTKALLKNLGVEHSYIDVDLLEGKDKEDVLKEIRKYADESFPLIIIDKKKVVQGFDEEEIRKNCK